MNIENIFNPAFKALGLSGGNQPKTKKKYKYKVTHKGALISRHYTKKQAVFSARKIRGAKWSVISSRRKTSTKPKYRKY